MNLLLDMSLREILTGITPVVRERTINVGQLIPSKPVTVRFTRSRNLLRCSANLWVWPLKYCIAGNTVKKCVPYQAVRMLNDNPRIYFGCDYELNNSGDWEYEFTH